MENLMSEDRNEGPPRKRLLTDQNPKDSFVTTSPESTVSTDSSSDRCAKKTRELPNLSDCHSCSVRINFTNPRERLQPLDSMWRVVLLCKKCSKRVKSSELCPYCFSAVVDEKDCFKCRDCQHSIHKDCVAKYGSGLGFSVCIDCWVPDAVVNSIRLGKRKSKKKNRESCDQAVTLPEARVSIPETNESDFVGEEVEKKVAAAAKASENALKKAVVAKNAVEIAKGVLKVAGSCETTAVDDVNLAFMLHRAINSSPRISRYACLMSSLTGDDAPITCYSRRRGSKKGGLICYSRLRRKGVLKNAVSFEAPLMCYSRRRPKSKAGSHVEECECYISELSERIHEHVSICCDGLDASTCGSDADNIINGIESEENDDGGNRYLLKYHRIGKGTPRSSVFVKDSGCGSSTDSANLNTEDSSDTRDFENSNECHESCEEINKNANRFLLTYKRMKRFVRSKPQSSCKIEEYCPVLPTNYLKESTTLTDTRLKSSCTASACLGSS